jgi:molybdenum cofactor cytidylyltransferase
MVLYSLILAAGFSSRMGTDKALLKIDGITVLDSIIAKIQPFSRKIIIVSGTNHQNLSAHLYGHPVDIIPNPNPEQGMFSSLKIGLKAGSDATHILIHLIDQPFIETFTYQKIVAAIDDQYQVIMPAIALKNRTGHPIIINKEIMQQIANAPHTLNLRKILHSLPAEAILRLPVDDIHILDNINTPGQLPQKSA